MVQYLNGMVVNFGNKKNKQINTLAGTFGTSANKNWIIN